MGGRFDGRVQRVHAPCCEGGFHLATIGKGVPSLSMQVRGFEAITVHDDQFTDPGTGQILQHRYAETACANHGNFGRLKALLSIGTHLR